jgi:hypothetical protein
MQRGNIITDLKALIGQGNDVGNSDLIAWINDAYMQAIDEVIKVQPDFFNKSAMTDTVNGQREYNLPSDWTKITTVNILQNGQWTKVTPMGDADKRFVPVLADTDNQGFSSSDPKYYIYGQKIGIIPTPVGTTANAIKIWYSYTPGTLDLDTDEPDLPEQYHRILKYLAYANFLDRDDEHVAAERMRNRFDALVQRMVETISEPQQDEVRRVERTQNKDLYSLSSLNTL